MSTSITLHFVTSSSDDPYLSKALRMFSMVCFVSGLMPPVTSFPELSVPSFPDSTSHSPARTASENGRFDAFGGFKYSTLVLAWELG